MLKKNFLTLWVLAFSLLLVGITSAQEATPEPVPTEVPPTVILIEGGDSTLVTTVQDDLRLLVVTVGIVVLGAAVNLLIKLFIQFREKYPREASYVLDAGDIVVRIVPGQMDDAFWAALRRRIEGKETVQDLRSELNDR